MTTFWWWPSQGALPRAVDSPSSLLLLLGTSYARAYMRCLNSTTRWHAIHNKSCDSGIDHWDGSARGRIVESFCAICAQSVNTWPRGLIEDYTRGIEVKHWHWHVTRILTSRLAHENVRLACG